VFNSYAANPFFIAGESYGGKYAPAFAYELMQQIDAGNSSINLKGVSIGDGAINPLVQFTDLSSLAYYFSFADIAERTVLEAYENQIRTSIGEGDYMSAFHVFDEMLNGDFFPFATYFHNITGLTDYFNMLSPVYPPNPYPDWMNHYRLLLNAGNGLTFHQYNATVEQHLVDDWMRSVAPKVEALLEKYPVLVYNGQLDVILGAPLALETLQAFHWSGESAWKAAPKKIWRLPSTREVAGYVKQAGTLTHVTVRKAGHLVPSDQPEFALDMISRWVLSRPF